MVLLAAYVLVSAIGFGLYLADHRLLGRAISDPASVTFGMALAIERHATTLAFLTVALVLATVVLFISWLWRSYDNVHAFGVRDPRFARGWTIGAWFVPVLNLVRPKQLVDDTWRGSMSPAEHAVRRWRTLRIPWPLHAWWAAWLVGGLLWRIGDVWYEAADGLEALRRS